VNIFNSICPKTPYKGRGIIQLEPYPQVITYKAK